MGGDSEQVWLRTANLSLCGSYRWLLSRYWGDMDRIVCWIMLNPSTADHAKDDPTIKRIVKFSQRWGYGGLVVANLFALRSPHPSVLREHPEPVGEYNLSLLRQAATDSQLVMAAWGLGGSYMDMDKKVLEQLGEIGVKPKILGATKDGHPIHPLARGKHRVPDDAQPKEWQ